MRKGEVSSETFSLTEERSIEAKRIGYSGGSDRGIGFSDLSRLNMLLFLAGQGGNYSKFLEVGFKIY